MNEIVPVLLDAQLDNYHPVTHWFVYTIMILVYQTLNIPGHFNKLQ